MDSSGLPESDLNAAIRASRKNLLAARKSDGHWAYELEADVTIPAEYIILNHFLGEIDDEVEAKLANYIRRTQERNGGWPLYIGGDFNVSASVKAYFALKLAGDSPDENHMRRAREAILAHGGAVNANVFTRLTLALFGQVPWSAAPVTRVEIMLFPRWFPLHINKVSYWTRTVTVPLLVLTALRPMAKNPRGASIDELFHNPPHRENYTLTNPTGHWIGNVMLRMDRIVRKVEHLVPKFLTRKAIDKALKFVEERLNGDDGLGGIFPAMANALMVFDTLGYAKDDPRVVTARKAIDDLLTFNDEEGFCQPCLSPVWDTGLATHAILESNTDGQDTAVAPCDWLKERQILDVEGDWIVKRTGLRPGGWAFQYRNDYYPDVDDTAVVVMALHRQDPEKYKHAIDRAVEWVIGMQSKSGGWAAFDADNEYYFLEHMPFADHGALLDPPTADVTARCISMLAQVGYDTSHPSIACGIDYLKAEQEEDGSWFGRWGTNYVYGTWSVLCALNVAGEDMSAEYVRAAVDWLLSKQRVDGGWGEDCASYWNHRRGEEKASLPSQTAWAVLGLMAAGEVENSAVEAGIDYLISSTDRDGAWRDDYFNAVGFPRVFYLRYHGYAEYFPLLALSRYKNLLNTNSQWPRYGM
jgi:squalene-hopene/tetraprenyl-beta-curcumene cyclase